MYAQQQQQQQQQQPGEKGAMVCTAADLAADRHLKQGSKLSCHAVLHSAWQRQILTKHFCSSVHKN
jgi:hypothetical protein